MFSLSLLNRPAKPNNGFTKNSHSAKRKLKKKSQASRKQNHQVIELVWLREFFTKKVATVLLILAVLLSVPLLLPDDDFMPINKIRVSGNYQQINTDNINTILDSNLGKGFFSVNIKSIQRSINLQPWVDTVSVKRIWPRELHVRLIQKKAVARWDSENLLSQQAVIFKADSQAFNHLPLISGYSGQSKELLQRYNQIQHEFSRHGIVVTEMSEDSKGALSLLLNKKIKVSIGSENRDMKLRHLLAVYAQQIKPRTEQIKHIDFRYNNGFAIAWKDDYLKQLDDAKKRSNKNV